MVTELEYRRNLKKQQIYTLLADFLQMQRNNLEETKVLDMKLVNGLVNTCLIEIEAIEDADFSDNFNYEHREEQPF